VSFEKHYVGAPPLSGEKERVMTRRSIQILFVAAGGMWVIAACGAPSPAEQQPAATPQASSAPPAVRSPVSINAAMVSIVDHAGHQLWNVEREGAAPKVRRDWEDLAEHATQLAAAGALIRVAGTGVQDETWVATPSWQKWARAMSDAAMAARTAIEAENFNALVAANGQLVESCESCHKEFKPQLPSEGITHMHAHEPAQ
jgi:hypothetical protein